MQEEHGGSYGKLSATRSSLWLMVCLLVALVAPSAYAQTAPVFDNTLNIPDIRQILPTATEAQGVSATLQILVLLTVLTLVPSILVMTTAFPRIVIVLSLFLTLLVMAPTWHKIQAQAVTPYFESQLGQEEAYDITVGHLKDFMYRQIEQADHHEDVYLFLEYIQEREIPAQERIAVADVPMTVMVPAFLLSELKTAFVMGFRIYLPFLVIDMVIASILISMGMMMLPPVLISLPFKILLFVLADGWHLIVEMLLGSFA